MSGGQVDRNILCCSRSIPSNPTIGSWLPSSAASGKLVVVFTGHGMSGAAGKGQDVLSSFENSNLCQLECILVPQSCRIWSSRSAFSDAFGGR